MPLPLLPTSLVGSYPQPEWLIDRTKLADSMVRRACAPRNCGASRPEFLDAGAGRRHVACHPRPGTRRARHHHRRRDAARKLFQPFRHRARRRRHRQSRHALDRTGHPNPVPRVVGKIRRKHPVEVRDVQFLRANTERTIKITVPGPFTMSQQAQNDFYKDEEEMALDYAAAVNAEIKDLFAAGADIVQIDEPYMQARPDKARQIGSKALNRALDGVTGTTAVHICFGYAAVVHEQAGGLFVSARARRTAGQQVSIETAQPKLDCAVLEKLPGKTIILGVLDLSDMTVETPETVAARIRRALPHVPAERIVVAPDCGMKYLPREVAFGKMQAMVEGAKIVREEQRDN